MTPSHKLRKYLLLGIGCLCLALPAFGGARAQTGAESVADETMALFDAVHDNDMAAAQSSVTRGADIDARDRWGMTPVEIAIDREYFEIAHYLMSVRNFQAAAAAEKSSASRPGRVPGQMDVASNSQALPSGEPSIGVAAFDTGAGLAASEADFNAPPAIAWPEDKPNPFDPSAPAHGTQKLMASDIGLTNLNDPFAPRDPLQETIAPTAE